MCRLATPGASGGRWCVPARSSARPTVSTGSARLAIAATVARRVELRQGLWAIGRYLSAHQFPPAHALLRLDGQYGTGAVLSDLAGFAFVTRGKDYTVLDHPLVQAQRAPASRSVPTAPGKPGRAQPLRLSRSAGWLRGRVVPRGGSDPIGPATRRVRLALRGQGLSTSCSSPSCRNWHSPLPMWSSCICIAAPLNRRLRTKIRRSTLIVGVVTPRAVKRHGVS